MALKNVPPEKMAETLIGQQIIGLLIDYDAQTITLELTDNDLEFEADGLRMACYELKKPRLDS